MAKKPSGIRLRKGVIATPERDGLWQKQYHKVEGKWVARWVIPLPNSVNARHTPSA